MQLKVVKTDGGIEEYLHTKVFGTISNALSAAEQADTYVAEQLAELVTYYLYHKRDSCTVSSGEILSIIQASLAAAGYEQAATALGERHFRRRLRRSCVEVVLLDIEDLCDCEQLAFSGPDCRHSWNKSRIVEDLVAKYGLCRQTARMVASMVEEKILNMEVGLIPVSLVKQLVLSDMAAVLRADRELGAVQPVAR